MFFLGQARNAPLIARSLDPGRFHSAVRLVAQPDQRRVFDYCALSIMEARRAPIQLLMQPDGSRLLALTIAREALHAVFYPLAWRWGIQVSKIPGLMEIGTPLQLAHLTSFPLPIYEPHIYWTRQSWAIPGENWFVCLDSPDGTMAHILWDIGLSSVRFATACAHLTYFATQTSPDRHFFLKRHMPLRRAVGLPYGQISEEILGHPPNLEAFSIQTHPKTHPKTHPEIRQNHSEPS